MDKRFVDGQNLAEAFEDQGIMPVLVLEVETAGLWDSVARIKF